MIAKEMKKSDVVDLLQSEKEKTKNPQSKVIKDDGQKASSTIAHESSGNRDTARAVIDLNEALSCGSKECRRSKIMIVGFVDTESIVGHQPDRLRYACGMRPQGKGPGRSTRSRRKNSSRLSRT
jgi:hypothetical protein